MGSGTVFFHAAEDWSWIDPLYFTIITLTTVGCGDLNPTKPGTKIFTIILILIGIGLLLAFIERLAR